MIVLVWSMKTFLVHIKWNIYDRPPSTIIHLSRHLTAKSNLSKWNFLKTKTAVTNHQKDDKSPSMLCADFDRVRSDRNENYKTSNSDDLNQISDNPIFTHKPKNKNLPHTPLSVFASRKLDPFNPISAAFVFLLIFLFTPPRPFSF